MKRLIYKGFGIEIYSKLSDLRPIKKDGKVTPEKAKDDASKIFAKIMAQLPPGFNNTHELSSYLEVYIDGGLVDCVGDGVIDKDLLNHHINERKRQIDAKRIDNFSKKNEEILL